MYEIEGGTVTPVRMEILNMISSQGQQDGAMSSYGFVSDDLVSKLDSVAHSVKKEIETKIEKREATLGQLRLQDHALVSLNAKN